MFATGSSLCKQDQTSVPQDDLGHNLEPDMVCEVVTERRREVVKVGVEEVREPRLSQCSEIPGLWLLASENSVVQAGGVRRR